MRTRVKMICDRCKAEIPAEAEVQQLGLLITVDDYVREKPRKVDLCRKCGEAFWEWLKEVEA